MHTPWAGRRQFELLKYNLINRLRAKSVFSLVLSTIKNMANEKLEKEIDKIQHELMVSETRYRKLFETSKDGILLIDPRTEKIIDANPALLKLTGHSLKNIVGKKLWEIGVIKDTEITKTLFETLQKKGFVHYEGLPLQTKDNKEHQVEFVSNKYPITGQR